MDTNGDLSDCSWMLVFYSQSILMLVSGFFGKFCGKMEFYELGLMEFGRHQIQVTWLLFIIDQIKCCDFHSPQLVMQRLLYFPGVRSTASCDICGSKNMLGTRWKCTVCDDYDLCDDCYHNDRHDLSHQFWRYDLPSTERSVSFSVFIVIPVTPIVTFCSL